MRKKTKSTESYKKNSMSSKRSLAFKKKSKSSSQSSNKKAKSYTSPVDEVRLVRLNKFIADCGVCSRRKADALIDEGAVKVNGKVTYEMGQRVNPEEDIIKVSGKRINQDTELVYYMFNKPKSVLTSVQDVEDRPVVLDYFKNIKKRIFPVGRLDWDSEGLLLLTNDGRFSQKVTHPKSEILKTYLVKIKGEAKPEKVNKLYRGVTIIGGKAKATNIQFIKRGDSTKHTWVKVSISEGRNRQIRKMFEKIGYDVIKLQRVAIGGLKLARLKKGEFKELTQRDLTKIFKPSHLLKDQYDEKGKKQSKIFKARQSK